MSDPQILQVPKKVHSVAEMFGVISQLKNIRNVIALVEDEEGIWTMVVDGITAERMNWMLDRAKLLLHEAD